MLSAGAASFNRNCSVLVSGPVFQVESMTTSPANRWGLASYERLRQVAAEGMSGEDRMRQIQVLDERGQILQGEFGGEGDIVRSRFAVGAHVPHNRALARGGQGLELCVEHVVIRAGTVRQHDRVPRPSTVRVSEHASRSVKPTSQIYHLLYISNNLKLSLGSPDKPREAAGTHRMPIRLRNSDAILQ